MATELPKLGQTAIHYERCQSENHTLPTGSKPHRILWYYPRQICCVLAKKKAGAKLFYSARFKNINRICASTLTTWDKKDKATIKHCHMMFHIQIIESNS